MQRVLRSALYGYTTYNVEFALAALKEGFKVSVCNPDDTNDKLWNLEQIEDCKGHMFLIQEKDY